MDPTLSDTDVGRIPEAVPPEITDPRNSRGSSPDVLRSTSNAIVFADVAVLWQIQGVPRAGDFRGLYPLHCLDFSI